MRTKLDESTKVTLTIKQLKRLVSEAVKEASSSNGKKVKLTLRVADYEHDGDFDYAIEDLEDVCPEVVILRKWSERNPYGSGDYEDRLGYIEFEVPAKYAAKFKKWRSIML